MRPNLCSVLFAVLLPMGATPLLAQGGKPTKPDKPKAEKPGKEAKEKDKDKAEPDQAAKGAQKDGALTAKDPVIVAIDKFRKAKVSTKRADWKTTLPAPPLQAFDGKRDYFWHVETNKGLLVIQLLPDAAPMHVTSTIYLARCGFYDELVFPRIMTGFMAQGGSPLNTQSGNAGYTMDGEFLTNRKHDAPGILSAANSNTPNSDGSQFFVTFVPTPHLDGKHTVFGVTTQGLDVLPAIEACGSAGGAVSERVAIVRTWITVAERSAPKAGEPAGNPAGTKPAEPTKPGK